MPHHTDSIENDEECESVVSNLPLLFAAGYPTSLEKITESQLEAFIPFMVQCSLGHVQIQNNFECSEPEWWPEDLEFTIPLRKPAKYTTSAWLTKLKEIVAICYTFHKSVFLLRFCESLATHQPESLRFINNYNSTTSLFDRFSNKLLVTFRNENMLYDQVPINHKKTLMPRTQSSQSIENNNERMVEQALFDIYLCDNCEAELYSLEAYTEHERICQEEDDDVIFCGAEQYTPIDDTMQQQATFLQNFQLGTSNIPNQAKMLTPHKRSHQHLKDDPMTPEMKLRRIPRRSRTVMILAKCPTIPISSPAGQRLMTTSKTVMNNEYVMERLDRCERFCSAPPLRADGGNRPKFMDKRLPIANTSSFRRTNGYSHSYRFPRRQFSLKWKERAFTALHSILLKQSNCKPLKVQLKRLTAEDIESYQLNSRLDRLKRLGQITLTKATKTAIKTNVIDFIDLCSSDEESDSSAAIGSSSSGSRRVGDNSGSSGSSGSRSSNGTDGIGSTRLRERRRDLISENNNNIQNIKPIYNSRRDGGRRNSIAHNGAINKSFDNFLGESITLERIINVNNNGKTNGQQIGSTAARKISAKQRRFTMHMDAAPSRLQQSLFSARLQKANASFASAMDTATVITAASTLDNAALFRQSRDEQTFNHQNQENTCRFLNGGTKSPVTRVTPYTKIKRITRDDVIKNSLARPPIQQKFISIDLT